MNAMPSLLQDWLGRLGEALLHSLWRGLAVALVLAVVLRALKSATPEVRYALSLLALAAVAIWPVAGLVGSVAKPAPFAVGLSSSGRERVVPIASKAPSTFAAEPPGSEGQPDLAIKAPPPPEAGDRALKLWTALPWLGVVWLLGVVGLSLRLIGGWLHAWRLVQAASLPASSSWVDALERVAAHLRIRPPVRLLESACVASPVVLGWLRPVILVPASALSGLTPAEIEAIVSHELAHVRRGDYLVNLLQTAVETLLFYHPAAWWIGRRIRFERELCCDDWAVRACADRRTYVQALVRLEELRAEAPASSFALAASAGPLRRRIERLLVQPAAERGVGLPAGIASLATALTLGFALALATGVVGPKPVQGAGDGRVLNFPEDRIVGTVFVRPAIGDNLQISNEFDGWKNHGEARGSIVIADGLEAKLSVNRAASQDLSWLASLAPDELAFLDLDDTAVNDAEMRHVGRLTGLRDLRMESTRVGDAGIRNLSGLKNLRYLQADAFGVSKEGFGIGDEGLAVLATLPKLEYLGLRRTQVSNAGMVHVGKMSRLKHLSISETKVTAEGLAHLTALRELESLTLGASRRGAGFGDAAMPAVAKLVNLRSLGLSGCPISDEGLAALAPLVHLDDLNLDNTKITEQGLAHLAPFQRLVRLRAPRVAGDLGAEHLSRLPNLEEVESNLHGLTDRGVDSLSRLSKLKKLHLSDSAITDHALELVARMPSLETLWLQDCPVTDEGLRQLERAPKLKSLLLSGTRMSSRGLHIVARLKHLERLNLHFPCATDPAKLDLSPLAELAGLKIFALDVPNITDDDLAPVAALSKLEWFDMGGEPNGFCLGDRGLAHLAGLQGLTELRLGNTVVTDDGLGSLDKLQNLQVLTLSAPITDAGLERLAGLRSLTLVQIASPSISDAGLARLTAALPAAQMVNRFTYHFYYDGQDAVINPRDRLYRTNPHERAPRDALEGKPAPELQATGWINTGGQPLSLAALRGKVVVLDQWGVWCGPCVKALPKLEPVYQKYKGRGVEFIALHTTQESEKAFEFVEQQKLSFPVAIDVLNQTGKAYLVDYVPDLCVIDKQGRLRMAGLHPADLEKAIELLLAE